VARCRRGRTHLPAQGQADAGRDLLDLAWRKAVQPLLQLRRGCAAASPLRAQLAKPFAGAVHAKWPAHFARSVQTQMAACRTRAVQTQMAAHRARAVQTQTAALHDRAVQTPLAALRARAAQAGLSLWKGHWAAGTPVQTAAARRPASSPPGSSPPAAAQNTEALRAQPATGCPPAPSSLRDAPAKSSGSSWHLDAAAAAGAARALGPQGAAAGRDWPDGCPTRNSTRRLRARPCGVLLVRTKCTGPRAATDRRHSSTPC
jgi:hypothetical protein